MAHETDTNSDTIIDLDADQVIEHVDNSKTQDTVVSASAKSRKRVWLYGAVALLASALAGGWLYKDVVSNYLPSDQVRGLSEKIVELDGRNSALHEQVSVLEKLSTQLSADIDSLEAKGLTLANLEEAVQKSQVNASQKLQTLERSLADTTTALTALENRPAVTASGATVVGPDLTALQQRMAMLERDVASLKVKPAVSVDNTVALSQNLSDLKAKIAGGTSYREEFDRIQRMVPAASGLDVLDRYAALGIPNAAGLAKELKDLTASLPKPIIPGSVPESQGWWAGVYNSLSDLITIRIDGDVDWPSAAAAAVAFAESGDLPQAIQQLKSIEGEKPVGVQQWLDRAAARLSVEQALHVVDEAVLRVIAAKG
jgi:hypothetical protein